MTTDELLDFVRLLELDHEPDGYPAVLMRDITALADEIERLREALRYAVAEANGWFEESRSGRIETPEMDACRALFAR